MDRMAKISNQKEAKKMDISPKGNIKRQQMTDNRESQLENNIQIKKKRQKRNKIKHLKKNQVEIQVNKRLHQKAQTVNNLQNLEAMKKNNQM